MYRYEVVFSLLRTYNMLCVHMLCPYCSSQQTKVVDKRGSEENRVVRRRRECIGCGKRFTTYERIRGPLIVIKRDGRKEAYDREKIRGGIEKAIKGRPISAKKLERLVDDIETEIKRMNCMEIKSRVIGDVVIEKLKKVDKVAYVRFMSFYKRFSDIKTFKKELGRR